jgi:hypothetical protein
MGLFSKSKPKTLFSLLKMNPDEVYSLNYEKISEEPNNQGQIVYTYRANLNKVELGIFDYVELVCWNPDLDFSKHSFNLFFKHRTGPPTKGKVRDITNLLASEFGTDEMGEKNITDQDIRLIDQGYWTGRSWYFDEAGKNKGNILEGSAGYNMMLNFSPDEGMSLNVIEFVGLIRIVKQNNLK